MKYNLSSKEMYDFSLLAKKHAVDYIALYGHKYIGLCLDKHGYHSCSMKVNGKNHNFKASSRKILTDVIFNGNKSRVHVYGIGIPFLRSVIKLSKKLYLNKDTSFTVSNEELMIINTITKMEKKSK